MTANRWIESFATADESQRYLLGGKGAGLAAMTQLGLPVPPGFIITTDACREFYDSGGVLSDDVWAQVEEALAELEVTIGKRLGDVNDPLLLSVRSGGPVSMPGMMDTILDLGMNRDTVDGLAALSGDAAFAWDAYRRFLQMYADVVLGVDSVALHAVTRVDETAGEQVLDARDAVTTLLEIVDRESTQSVPHDPHEQLRHSVEAVFESWMNRRAVDYRKAEGIPDDLYTAVNVQAMVFGNTGENSGTGVVFTRDPTSGEPVLWGEYLPNAQGEDIVAGLRTPLPVSVLAEAHPDVFLQLEAAAGLVERHNKDMQDMEFTVEDGKLWMLQTRRGKRAGRSAVRCAVDMADEGLISRQEAIERVSPSELDELLHPVVEPGPTDVVFATGLAASPGGASGTVALTADEAERLAEAGHDVVLVRDETSPDDFHGMVVAKAIVTARGGMTSHAAVVARGMGICCVVGCRDIVIDEESQTVTSPVGEIRAGDSVTVDGSTGRVYLGTVPTTEATQDEFFDRLLHMAADMGGLGVRANADTPQDARVARGYGAEGIGLCRTEHMFFQPGRIEAVRAMIMAKDGESRARSLEAIEPFQAKDFEEIFTAMDGLPVTIRLLDPPLHEFLPNRIDTFESIVRLEDASEDGSAADRHEIESELEALRLLLARTDRLAEVNPMLGHRGARLGVTFPEITRMQARAIFTAAIQCAAAGVTVLPEIMVPLVAYLSEYEDQKRIIIETATEVFDRLGTTLDYRIGSMIELPRAALIAGEIAAVSDFISFGTNDLTQTTLGLSRDDSSRFLPGYLSRGIVDTDPFVELDLDGVGRLVSMATAASRASNPTIKVGVCGEHGGDPTSVAFFASLGLDYVSCSPFRVPIARLATAKAAVQESIE